MTDVPLAAWTAGPPPWDGADSLDPCVPLPTSGALTAWPRAGLADKEGLERAELAATAVPRRVVSTTSTAQIRPSPRGADIDLVPTAREAGGYPTSDFAREYGIREPPQGQRCREFRLAPWLDLCAQTKTCGARSLRSMKEADFSIISRRGGSLLPSG